MECFSVLAEASQAEAVAAEAAEQRQGTVPPLARAALRSGLRNSRGPHEAGFAKPTTKTIDQRMLSLRARCHSKRRENGSPQHSVRHPRAAALSSQTLGKQARNLGTELGVLRVPV